MTRELIGIFLILLVVVIALNIYRKIKLRRRSQESVLPEPVSAIKGKHLFEGFYVATVFADKPLERVWAFGLGGRGKSTVSLSDRGIGVARVGERDFLIPFEDIVTVQRAMATIDRGVEKRGLLQIEWKLGEQKILTSFRVTTNQEETFRKLKMAIGVTGE